MGWTYQMSKKRNYFQNEKTTGMVKAPFLKKGALRRDQTNFAKQNRENRDYYIPNNPHTLSDKSTTLDYR
jgi:hypothetical protein